jgi:hypothetical protein
MYRPEVVRLAPIVSTVQKLDDAHVVVHRQEAQDVGLINDQAPPGHQVHRRVSVS